MKVEQEQYLYWHPVAFKVQVDDVADLLGTTMLACHHDVQQPALWVDLQGLTHTSGQIERPGWLTFHLYTCSKCSQHAIICKLQHMQHRGILATAGLALTPSAYSTLHVSPAAGHTAGEAGLTSLAQ